MAKKNENKEIKEKTIGKKKKDNEKIDFPGLASDTNNNQSAEVSLGAESTVNMNDFKVDAALTKYAEANKNVHMTSGGAHIDFTSITTVKELRKLLKLFDDDTPIQIAGCDDGFIQYDKYKGDINFCTRVNDCPDSLVDGEGPADPEPGEELAKFAANYAKHMDDVIWDSVENGAKHINMNPNWFNSLMNEIANGERQVSDIGPTLYDSVLKMMGATFMNFFDMLCTDIVGEENDGDCDSCPIKAMCDEAETDKEEDKSEEFALLDPDDVRVLESLDKCVSHTTLKFTRKIDKATHRPMKLTTSDLGIIFRYFVPENVTKVTIDYPTDWDVTIKYRVLGNEMLKFLHEAIKTTKDGPATFDEIMKRYSNNSQAQCIEDDD